jgi:DNA-binding MarR family transcriptional regulator
MHLSSSGKENGMTPDGEMQTAVCHCLALRQAARHVTRFYDQALAPTGLRSTQFSILSKLKRLGPLTVNALAAEMAMDRTTLGRTMLPLERDGLIAIGSGVEDRRSKQLQITRAGGRRLDAALALWTRAQKRFEAEFGGKRASSLRSELRAVVASKFA